MVFEQEYTIKFKVTGTSTLKLEVFETMLTGLLFTHQSNKNVSMEIKTKDGEVLSPLSDKYTFDRFIGNKNIGPEKNKSDG